jgi:hypothetical protein
MSKLWNETEIQFLKENYKEKGAEYCATKLDRKIYAVRRKANKVGASKDRTIYEKDKLEAVVFGTIIDLKICKLFARIVMQHYQHIVVGKIQSG